MSDISSFTVYGKAAMLQVTPSLESLSYSYISFKLNFFVRIRAYAINLLNWSSSPLSLSSFNTCSKRGRFLLRITGGMHDGQILAPASSSNCPMFVSA